MINQTVYNLRRNLEAKRTAQGIVDYLEGREKNIRFRNFLIQNKSLLIEAKNQKKEPNAALQEMVDKYHQSLDKIEQQGEKFAELNGQLVIAKEEKEEFIKNKKKKKKKRRKKKKKEVIANERFLVLMEEFEKEEQIQREIQRKQIIKTRENFIRLAKEYNLKIKV
jgi:hypothetical protein